MRRPSSTSPQNLLGIVGLLLAELAVRPTEAAGVSYEKKVLSRTTVHVITVDLNNPAVRVTPFVTQGFPSAAEDFASMVRRAQPVAAINGTFSSKQTLKPTGDIVIDGRQVYFGGMGTALAIDPQNKASIIRVPWGRHVDWTGYETVLGCGPNLMKNGLAEVDPDLEGFSDPHVLSPAVRSAVGVTEWNKLRLVCVPSAVSLSKLAAIMAQLNCLQAMNLDGGASMAMYYRGRILVTPARPLTNLLVVYEDGRPATTPPPPQPAQVPPPAPSPHPPTPPGKPETKPSPATPTSSPTPTPPSTDTGESTPSARPEELPRQPSSPADTSTEEGTPPEGPMISRKEESRPATEETSSGLQEAYRSLLSRWDRLTRAEQIVLGLAGGLTLLGLLHFLFVTRASAERLGGLGSLVRAGNAYLLSCMLGTLGWLALLQFAFQAPPEVVSPWGATIGLVLCLWTGLVVSLLHGDNVSDGVGYGTLAALVASGGFLYYRSHPLLALFADWTWWKLLLLSAGTGFFSGLCLGFLLHRLRPRGLAGRA